MRQKNTLHNNVTLSVDEQVFADYTGVIFSGLSVNEKPEGWSVVIRGYDKRCPVYAVSVGADLEETFIALLDYIASKDGPKAWREDRYRTKQVY